jgi:hypothetical protein
MDPRWIVRFRSDDFEAELFVFYGPLADVSAFRRKDPERGYLVGGEDEVTDERLIEMLDDLALATSGGPDPTWLRLVPN